MSPVRISSLALIRLVILAVEDVFQVDHRHLFSPSRKPIFSWPRQVAMVALMDQLGLSSTSAARAFRRRDHATALHARRVLHRRVASSTYDRAKIRQLLTKLAELRRIHSTLKTHN
jgi:chromosomal replication initiation ATPase DnaA